MKKGFTLIELLVVISIIGILVAVAMTSYTSTQIKARDSRRRSDMKAIQTVMEQYYATNGGYPATINAAFTSLLIPAPVDPKNTDPYQYNLYEKISAINDTYCICAKLEESNKGNASNTAASGCTWGGNQHQYFCVQNQQ